MTKANHLLYTLNIMNKTPLNITGLKNTGPSLAVYSLLKNKHEPLSAQKIWQKLKKKNNLVSIYRILERLSKAGLIKTDIILDKKQRSEKVYYLSENHHHHFVCEKFQGIFCLPCPIKIKLPKNFKLKNHQITISGSCPKCH